MCDYSLQHVDSRPAKVGDRLIAINFAGTFTRGFAAVGEQKCAVCLTAGTELAFETNVQYHGAFSLFRKKSIRQKLARFRQINLHDHHAHHDALEFPDGQIVMVTRLIPGQRATVLQLPASEPNQSSAREATEQDLFALVSV